MGFDENGCAVKRNINTSGKYGAGQIYNSNNTLVNIKVERYAYGKLKGEDENGITYQLTAN